MLGNPHTFPCHEWQTRAGGAQICLTPGSVVLGTRTLERGLCVCTPHSHLHSWAASCTCHFICRYSDPSGERDSALSHDGALLSFTRYFTFCSLSMTVTLRIPQWGWYWSQEAMLETCDYCSDGRCRDLHLVGGSLECYMSWIPWTAPCTEKSQFL